MAETMYEYIRGRAYKIKNNTRRDSDVDIGWHMITERINAVLHVSGTVTEHWVIYDEVRRTYENSTK